MAFKQSEQVSTSASPNKGVNLVERSYSSVFCPQSDLENGSGATVVAVLSPQESETFKMGDSVFLNIA